jgi:hypothetical protein
VCVEGTAVLNEDTCALLGLGGDISLVVGAEPGSGVGARRRGGGGIKEIREEKLSIEDIRDNKQTFQHQRREEHPQPKALLHLKTVNHLGIGQLSLQKNQDQEVHNWLVCWGPPWENHPLLGLRGGGEHGEERGA